MNNSEHWGGIPKGADWNMPHAPSHKTSTGSVSQGALLSLGVKMDLATIIAAKTAEIEAAGFCSWTYRKVCRWCADGYTPVPSSVSDAMVHPDTSVGRVVCVNGGCNG